MIEYFQKAGEKHKEIMQIIKKEVKPGWKASEIRHRIHLSQKGKVLNTLYKFF